MIKTNLNDSSLGEKWEKAANELEKLVADEAKLTKLMCEGMDPCVAPVCNAMNLVPAVSTNSSCEGHGNQDFFVQFYCSSMPSLHFLCDVFSYAGVTGKLEDGREFDFTDWDIELTNWHACLSLRRFEVVEFCAYSKSLGAEKDKELKLEVAKETARVIASKAREYATDLKQLHESKLQKAWVRVDEEDKEKNQVVG